VVIPVFVLTALGSLSQPAHAYFLDAAYGVRPAGMGEAFVAVADDANAALFNPAGFSRLSSVELLGMYSDLYANMSAPLYNGMNDHAGYNFIAAGVPLGQTLGTLGASWLQFDSVFYKENTFMLSYGRRVLSLPGFGKDFTLDAGASFKALQWTVAANDFTTDSTYYPFSAREKTGYTGDVGLLGAFGNDVFLGFSLENAVPADIGLTVQENVAPVYRAGAAYHWAVGDGLLTSILVSLECSERDGVFDPKGGCEAWFLRKLAALRVGASAEGFTSGLSFQQAWPGTPLEIQLDYAFTYPFYLESSGGSHRLGMVFRWNSSTRESTAGSGSFSRILGPPVPSMIIGPQQEIPPVRKIEPEPVEIEDTTDNLIQPVRPLVLPERNRDRIVIGIETKIYSDYGSVQNVQAVMLGLDRYLRKTTGAEFEWKDCSLEDLRYGLVNGEMDAVISYSEVFRSLWQQGALKPILTILNRGSDKQRCCLIVRGDSPLVDARSLKGKRLGYMDSEVLPRLKAYFFKDVPEYRDVDYFVKIEKLKNAIDSLMALQMDTVDAIVAFEYVLPICHKMTEEVPRGVKVISRSELIPNLPVFFRPSASRIKNKKMLDLAAALLKYNEQPEAKPFFEFFNFDRFVEWDKKQK
jgi:ABC-type phosphate/phosphonate transport system substrate-binding protein